MICHDDDRSSWLTHDENVTKFIVIIRFLARGLGVKVKGRVEKQDCNEQ